MNTGSNVSTEAFTKPAMGPPRWFVILTAAFTLMMLMMAVAETTLWTHYLIDQGEYLSVAGLVFILAAGVLLYRQGRLWTSLPLAVPWLIYPIVTQGDQIIDNLTINQMRIVVHLILAVLFGAPVVILGVAARQFLRLSGRGVRYVTALLLLSEFYVAYAYLGMLMIATLAIVSIPLIWILPGRLNAAVRESAASRANRIAMRALVISAMASFALYIGFKNRPGAYQGSPSFFLDSSQKDALYDVTKISLPATVDAHPLALPQGVQTVLAEYGNALATVCGGYYILDRNYNYAFHNALFLRSTPLLPDFRREGLRRIQQAREVARQADAQLISLRAGLDGGGPAAAFLDEIQGYVAYTFRRASLLEEMTARFERTQAGLQHATHLYEGENKMLGVMLMRILEKHHAVLERPEVRAAAATFIADGRTVYEAYANRIVGF